LAVADFLNSLLDIYHFDGSSFEPIQHLSRQELPTLLHPVDVSVSPDQKWLAITNYASRESSVDIYPIDETHRVVPQAIAHLQTPERTHGVQFSADGQILAFTAIYPQGNIHLYRVSTDGAFTPHQVIRNRLYPLRPKALTFSPDGKVAVVGYSLSVVDPTRSKKDEVGLLEVYAIDASGTFSARPVRSFGPDPDLGSIEDIVFCPDGKSLLVSNTLYDEILVQSFDPESLAIGPAQPFLSNPEAGLYHPHGFALSSSGAYLAVTNNDDTSAVLIYRIQN
jgi:6-phosphogluconolactonase (cycloisomerase 2 family)